MNVLRRLPLSRLLIVCALVIALGASATAIALAVGDGPVPRPEPLADAIHDALGAPAVEGFSASVTLSDHLLEGASLSSSGEASHLASSPLLAGASGRLWVARDGRVRLELQSEEGDTQIISDGRTLSLYDAATNTLYRYTAPAKTAAADAARPPASVHTRRDVPSVAKIKAAISHLEQSAKVSGATPADVAGQPAYTVRVSPLEAGSLFDGAELSFDAAHGVPLRAAIYSSASASPVIELAATAVSFGAVSDSIFSFSPPPNAKVVDLNTVRPKQTAGSVGGEGQPHVKTYGHGPGSVAVLSQPAPKGSSGELAEGLPTVKIDGVSASELTTELGTLLSFERDGVRYLLLGSVPAQSVEAVARGL